jgi:hypothetical protein
MTSLISRHGLTVNTQKVTAKEAYSLLKEPWCELHDKQQTKFFLSWQWIGQWLLSLPSDINVNTFVFERNNELVGVAAVPERYRKSIFWSVKQGHLNRTGDDTLDQIWIENNKVLTSLSNPVDIAAFYELIMEEAHLDERMISVMSGDDYIGATEFKLLNSMYNVELEYEENGYYLPIKKGPHLQSKYSKSLKRQLKQTIKTGTELSWGFRFEEITEPQCIRDTLEEASCWHIGKWENSSTPSGFTNPHFKEFHNNLIATSGSTSCRRRVRLFSLFNGDSLLGVLYGFQEGDWFGFYLSSIKPVADNRLRLGLYMHDMAIKRLSDSGVSVYDFMAGEARYKKQFGSMFMRYGKMKIQRKRLALNAEKWLKRMKKLIDKKS